jgi:hypothetical protein
MMDAKMQQFNKVILNMYQNNIFTDLNNIVVKSFKNLKKSLIVVA